MVSVSYIVDDQLTDLQVICERVDDELIVYGLIGDPAAIAEITQAGDAFDPTTCWSTWSTSLIVSNASGRSFATCQRWCCDATDCRCGA